MQPDHIQRQHGGTLLGFIIGLVIGLGIAVIIAMMITKTPMPFNNNKQGKADKSPATSSSTPSDDPNQPMYGNRDAIKDIIKNNTPDAASDDSSKTEAPKTEPAKTEASTNEKHTYYLQAGAFRAESDANDMSAKLALLGFEASTVEINTKNGTLYRVRLGPLKQDEMGRVKNRLAENGISTSATRIQK